MIQLILLYLTVKRLVRNYKKRVVHYIKGSIMFKIKDIEAYKTYNYRIEKDELYNKYGIYACHIHKSYWNLNIK